MNGHDEFEFEWDLGFVTPRYFSFSTLFYVLVWLAVKIKIQL